MSELKQAGEKVDGEEAAGTEMAAEVTGKCNGK